jgi:hypothetical protein
VRKTLFDGTRVVRTQAIIRVRLIESGHRRETTAEREYRAAVSLHVLPEFLKWCVEVRGQVNFSFALPALQGQEVRSAFFTWAKGLPWSMMVISWPGWRFSSNCGK